MLPQQKIYHSQWFNKFLQLISTVTVLANGLFHNVLQTLLSSTSLFISAHFLLPNKSTTVYQLRLLSSPFALFPHNLIA